MTLSLENIQKARSLGATDEQILGAIQQKDQDFGTKISRAREMGATNEQMIKSIESHLEKSNTSNVKPLYTPENALDQNQINTQEQPQQAQPQSYADLIRPVEYTPEQLKNMTLSEKREYIQDLNRYREYMSSRSNIKSFVDTASFGLVPKFVPSLKKTEEEAEFSGLIGGAAGLSGPGALLFKFLGRPVVNLVMRAPKYIPGINAIAHMTGAGVTGAAYGGIYDTVVNEQLPTGKQLATHFAEWALFDGVLRGLVNGGTYLSRLQQSRSIKKINEVIKRVDLTENNPEKLSQQIQTALDEVIPESAVSAKKQELVENRAKKTENIQQETLNKPSEIPEIQEQINNIPGKNKRKLAQESFDDGNIKNQEQLDAFLDRYESVYPTIPGKTTSARNRKFMNRFGEPGLTDRNISTATEQPIEIPVQRKLEEAVTRLREARINGDKSKIKQAQRQVDLLKRKIKNAQTQSVKNINIKNQPHTENVNTTSISSDIQPVESSNITLKPKPLSVKVKPQEKPPEPITEQTGKSAEQQVDIEKTRAEKIKDVTNSAIHAVKNPQESIVRAGEIINENIFNYLAPLEKIEGSLPIEERPSTFIRRAEDANSTVNSIIENGIFSDLTNQIEHGGLKQAYGSDYIWRRRTKKSKPDEASIQDLSIYRTAKQSLKRQSEGKKTGIDTQLAQEEVARLGGKYEPIAQRVRQFQRDVVTKYGHHLLGPEGVNAFNKDYYSAMYRVMDTGADSMLQSNSLQPKKWWHSFKGSQRRIIDPAESDIYNTSMMVQNSKKNEAILKYREGVENGSLPGKVVESKRNKLSEATKAELEAKDIDLSNEELVENLYEQSRTNAFTPSKNRLRGWKDGKPFEIEVPDEVAEVFKGLEPYQQGILSKGMSYFNRQFSNLLTFLPSKFLSILGRDAWSAYVWTHTGVNPKVMAQALSHVYYDHPTYQQFLQEGGDRFALRLSTRMQRAKKIQELVTPGTEGPIVPFNKFMDGLNKYGLLRDKLGIAVSYAEYLKGLEKYGNTSQGRIKAMYDAKRVTYDPKARGKSKVIRELAPAINYLNVGLQDLAMNIKNLKRPEVIARGMATISSVALALKMINEGNPKYDALSAADKAAFFHIFIGDTHLRVPVPWLMGTLFKVIPETLYDTARGKGKEASKGLIANFVENTSGSLNPILKTAVEVSTGKQPADFLGFETRSPEVIPKRLQHLPKELQYTSTTSLASRKLAPAIGMSPVMMDRILNNLGPGTPKAILNLIDEVAYQTGLAEDKRPEKSLVNYLILGNFFTQGPESRTKYAEKFYEYLEASRTAKSAQKNGLDLPDTENLTSVAWDRYNRQISKLFQQYRDTQEQTMDKSEKKNELQHIQKQINDLYKQAVQEFENK